MKSNFIIKKKLFVHVQFACMCVLIKVYSEIWLFRNVIGTSSPFFTSIPFPNACSACQRLSCGERISFNHYFSGKLPEPMFRWHLYCDPAQRNLFSQDPQQFTIIKKSMAYRFSPFIYCYTVLHIICTASDVVSSKVIMRIHFPPFEMLERGSMFKSHRNNCA